MPTFVMLTRVSPDAITSPHALKDLERQVMDNIHTQCPQVKWIHNYAILGPYDYLDIFDAPDTDTAAKVSTLIRSYGHAYSEVWAATEWDKFKHMLDTMPTKSDLSRIAMPGRA